MAKHPPRLADFEQIVATHHQLVFRTAIGFVHNKEDAEDLTQEVFINAYRHWEQFRGEAKISTWLYRITVNLSINYVTQQHRKRLLTFSHTLLGHLFNRPGDEKNPQQQLEAEEQEAIVRRAIDALPEKQRVAFILSRYDDLPQKEVAAIMNITEGAVEQLLQRAKVNLQKKLQKQ